MDYVVFKSDWLFIFAEEIANDSIDQSWCFELRKLGGEHTMRVAQYDHINSWPFVTTVAPTGLVILALLKAGAEYRSQQCRLTFG